MKGDPIDLLNKYLKGCSPYILKMSYNLRRREIVVVCANNTIDWSPKTQLKFTDVVTFSEEVFEDLLDDELIDSIMGFHEMAENVYCLSTEKRELIIKARQKPISEDISQIETNSSNNL